MTEATPPPPGSRVRVRGEEWAVQKCLPLSMGGYAVHVQGVSELVRHHQAIFVTTIDTDIEPLRPEDTRLVPDTSPRYRQRRWANYVDGVRFQTAIFLWTAAASR